MTAGRGSSRSVWRVERTRGCSNRRVRSSPRLLRQSAVRSPPVLADDEARAAAARVAGRREPVRACAPRPGRRRSRCCGPGQRTTCSPAASSASSVAPGMPPSQSRTSPSGCTRASSTASCSGNPRSSAATTTCTIAERMRAEPDEPTTSSTAPAVEHERRRHHARQPHARRELQRRDVEIRLAQHVVEVDARAGHDDARAAAGRTGQRGSVPVAVEDADLGCPGGSRRPIDTLPRVSFGRSRPPPAPAGRPRRGRARARTRASAARSPSAGRPPRGRRSPARADSRSGGPLARTASAWAISARPRRAAGS